MYKYFMVNQGSYPRIKNPRERKLITNAIGMLRVHRKIEKKVASPTTSMKYHAQKHISIQYSIYQFVSNSLVALMNISDQTCKSLVKFIFNSMVGRCLMVAIILLWPLHPSSWTAAGLWDQCLRVTDFWCLVWMSDEVMCLGLSL